MGALERAIDDVVLDEKPARLLAQILRNVRVRAAAMSPATGPSPAPAVLAKAGLDMAKDLDTLEDLLEAFQLFAGGS